MLGCVALGEPVDLACGLNPSKADISGDDEKTDKVGHLAEKDASSDPLVMTKTEPSWQAS